MDNDNLHPALIEAYATAQSDIAVLDTLEIRHPSVSIQTRVLDIAFIIDLSGSMDAAFPAVKSAVSQVSAALSTFFEEIRFGLITYGASNPTPILQTTEFIGLDAFLLLMDTLNTSGGTEPGYDASILAANSLPWTDAQQSARTVYLLSDEPSNGDINSQQDAIDALNAQNVNFVFGIDNSYDSENEVPSSSWSSVENSYLPVAEATNGIAIPSNDANQMANQFVQHILNTVTLTRQDSIFLIRDFCDRELGLETGQTQLFTATGFQIQLPARDDKGVQDLNVSIDNTNRVVSDFIKETLNYPNEYIELKYRPYLSNDLSQPQMDPPLILYLSEVSINASNVSGKATFADILNKTFPSELYTRTRFPAL